MGALTITDLKTTEFAGDYKMVVGEVTLTAASDTVTLTDATNHISEIHSVFATIKTGLTTAFVGVAATYSSLVITLTPFGTTGNSHVPNAEGASAVVALMVVGK